MSRFVHQQNLTKTKDTLVEPAVEIATLLGWKLGEICVGAKLLFIHSHFSLSAQTDKHSEEINEKEEDAAKRCDRL